MKSFSGIKKIKFFLIVLLACNLNAAYSQVTGLVHHHIGKKPIAGATVNVLNTNINTLTGKDGSFKINIPTSAATLEFSYPGLETRRSFVNNGHKLKIYLNTPDLYADDEEKALKDTTVYGGNKEKAFLQVKGILRDSVTGERLPGVSIREIATQAGTLSAKDGSYKINVPPSGNAALRFTYVGYKFKRIPVNGRQNIDIVLVQDTANLDETISLICACPEQIGKWKKESVTQVNGIVRDSITKEPLAGVSVRDLKTKKGVATAKDGSFVAVFRGDQAVMEFSYIGYKTTRVNVGNQQNIEILLSQEAKGLQEVVVIGYRPQQRKSALTGSLYGLASPIVPQHVNGYEQLPYNTESYKAINENRFLEAKQNPLSTFGIDVDAASYSNIRRYINNGSLPPKDAVRIEEMINYFDYDYPQPKNDDPVTITTETSVAPWNPQHRLVKIGLQAKTIPTNNLPASNLIFLIDVSGSMDMPNKLPLVQSSMRLLADQLREKDKVAIVVYAGAAGLVLPPTSGDNKQKIKDAINNLEAGGSTAGGEGINLAYRIAKENFIKNGNNRVILATDGDFNTGASSDAEMQRLIEEKRQTGIYLTVLGYGMGNYKDSKMETLADKGNGNYAYIDNISEAKKTLVTEFGGTLFTIAKDVKLQVEFNPAKAGAYRLIGYENRMLNKEDFNNDKKDAGDLGSGHTVTALYEVIPAGVKSKFLENVDELKYQKPTEEKDQSTTNELLTIKLRYKKPGEETSRLMSKAVTDEAIRWDNASNNFRFASAVAAYGMVLRDSEFKQNATYATVINWAENARGEDNEGYRAEFIKLVKTSSLMAKDLLSLKDKMIMVPSH